MLKRCDLTRKSQEDLIEAYKIIYWTGRVPWERFWELAPGKVFQEHRHTSFKKPEGRLGQKFFTARVVDLCEAVWTMWLI